MNRERITQVLLAIGVIIIWVVAGKRVINYTANVGDNPSTSQTSTQYAVDFAKIENNTRYGFVYNHTVRNPFVLEREQHRETQQTTSKPEPKPTIKIRIPLSVEGILYQRKTPLAMLESDDGQMYFLTPLDSVLQYRVERITADSVYLTAGQTGLQALGLSP